MNEAIKVIPGCDGRYSITESGTVISHLRNSGQKCGDNRINRNCDNGHGRLCVGLSIGRRKRKTFRVHRLVCLAFHGQAPAGKNEVNHIDGNPKNNHFTNLEWCSRSENMRHAVKLGLANPNKGEDHYCARLSASDIPVIREMMDAGFPAEHVGAMWGITGRHVADIHRRDKWRHVA
jgi:hypothetical protein